MYIIELIVVDSSSGHYSVTTGGQRSVDSSGKMSVDISGHF